MNRSLSADGDQDLVQGMMQQQRDLKERLDALNTAWSEMAAREPVQTLQAEAENAAKLRAGLDQQVANTELEIADAADRLKQASASEAVEIRKQDASARARLEQLRRQIQTIDRQSAERERLLASRVVHRERTDVERKAVLTQLTGVETQLREARGGASYRGERLRIVDPGIVPERPSSPNVPLNVAGALLLGLALPIIWLTLRMGFDDQRAVSRRGSFQAFAKARDE
jgi:uncharacterized protein involved in exopolysaccharide biosynthesis